MNNKEHTQPAFVDLDKIEELAAVKEGILSVGEVVDVLQKSVSAGPGQKGGGLRYNQGKVRHDLLPAWAVNEVARVFTRGAEKYAERNWEKGMPWSKVLASLKRHLNAIEQGEDFDFDRACEGCQKGRCTNHTGLYHAAHLATNALFLLQYYKIFPQGDDRPHAYLNQSRIGLDIDEVLCDWLGGYQEYTGVDARGVPNWNFSYAVADFYRTTPKDEMERFYENLRPKLRPEDIPFEPHCYITSRGVDAAVTKHWLERHGFPTVPVYSIGHGASKVDVARAAGVDIFVDDRYENFVELNRAGICTYLYDAPHNRRYNVGFKRIKSLKELL